MEMLKISLYLCLYLCTVIKPSSSYQNCSEPTLFEDLDSEKYQGLWFEIERVLSDPEEPSKCITHKYVWAGKEMQIDSNGLTEEDTQTGSLKIEEDADPVNPAYMTITPGFSEGADDSPYKILDTDYENYACVYSCTNDWYFLQYFYIYGRAPVLDQKFVDKCQAKFKEAQPDMPLMNKTIHDDACPYWNKLPKMLEDSKAELSQSKAIDEMQASLSSSGSSSTAGQENTASKSAVKTDSSASSQASNSDGQGGNGAPHVVSSTNLLTLFTIAFLAALMH